MRKYLDVFCTAYLNDILIYSKNEKKHTHQVLKILRKLKKRGLQVDIDKGDFLVTEVKYLGLIIRIEGIKMNSKKVKAILKGETPNTVKKVQRFLEFANFTADLFKIFQRKSDHLPNGSEASTSQLKQKKKQMRYNEFVWTNECQKAFDDLKTAFNSASILVHYDPNLETGIKTNVSDFVIVGILSQMHEKTLKPVIFFFENNVISRMQLHDLRQKIVNHYQNIGDIKIRNNQHKFRKFSQNF